MLVTLFCLTVLPLILCAIIYNGFIHRRNRVKQAFAGIDVQLKKRWDLVPNLVQTAKTYAKHEKETLEQVVQARQSLIAGQENLGQRLDKEKNLSLGLGRLMALAESYPDLKADASFLNLQKNLTEIEAQIAAARRAYNSAVMSWNTGVQMFPGSLFAKVFGFAEADWFEMPEIERVNPQVDFS